MESTPDAKGISGTAEEDKTLLSKEVQVRKFLASALNPIPAVAFTALGGHAINYVYTGSGEGRLP